MDLSISLLMSVNDVSLENKEVVIKVVADTVQRYDCMNHCKNKNSRKYNGSMKIDIAVQSILDLNIV